MIEYIDPIRMLIAIFEERYPDKDAQVDLVDGMDHKKCLGETCFDDDGKVYIQISIHQTLPQLLDILAHELAHLAAGVAAAHGQEWEAIYGWLHDAYILRMAKALGLEDGGQ